LPGGAAGKSRTPLSRSRLLRLVVVPAALFVLVSVAIFTLARLSLAKPGASPSGQLRLGDAYRGEIVFQQTCAGCHGAGGKGGNPGPRLVGNPISLAAAKTTIDNGRGVMPAGLVTGKKEEDVLAYLATILGRGQTP
jgi:mono/diheme cytochrome c family protein